MTKVTNPRVLMNKYIDDGYPIPGETIVYDTTEQIDLDSPLEGGVLVKVIFVGIDPYQRGRMRSPNPKSKSYSVTSVLTILAILFNLYLVIL